MRIELQDAGKRYNRDWIFRNLNYVFSPGGRYALTGPNGSGKSTLLQCISGAGTLSSGTITYQLDQNKIPADRIHKQIAFCAPYLELVEEMTLQEALQFHQGFKPFFSTIDFDFIAKAVGLEKAMHKEMRYYSSGMKQRVRLAQAFFSDTPVLLLDEPTSNLDAAGIAIYEQLIGDWTKDRLLIVASNVEAEYKFCEAVIQVEAFK